MSKVTPGIWLQRLSNWSLSCSLAILLSSCSYTDLPIGSSSLNSRYTEEQPTLSGNGRFLGFISNRNGNHQLLLFDIQQQQFVRTPNLNRARIIVEAPSLSYSARYIVYMTTDRGRPVVSLYDRATKQSQVLTSFYPGWVRNPSISPDGRYVTFETSSRGQWDIEVLDRGPNIELDIPDGTPTTAPTE
ncbi:MAG: hypothetical protein QNJ49_20295 [Mastigocoleus sp. MO_167.B18]|nr:hypothetical protein [Mastigocoleus sp. MO_167.B18]